MSKKLTLFSLLILLVSTSKAQQTCVTAVNTIPATTCNYSTHTTNGTEYWLTFVATSPTVNISLVTVKFGINAPHIHNLALLIGSCGSQTLIAEDELPFVADAKELAIDLNASGLIVGQTYYIRATRTASLSVGTCDKSGCTSNGSTDPTSFDICVQDIDVIIPKDFGLELPSISHAYTTNRGQLVDVNGNQRPEIKLYNDRTSPAVYIADDKISYVFSKIDTSSTTPDTLHRVDVSLVGSTPTKAFKTEQISGYTNYYLGHIPQGVTNNKSYSRAVCNEVYPNIDMQYYSNQKGLKYYFIVKPGGDPDNIILKFDGATAINVTPTGGLEIVTSIGTLDFEPPHAYRINPAGNPVPMPWQAKFEAIPTSTNEVKFKLHNYDPIMPLFIQVDRGHQIVNKFVGCDWSTYHGGGGFENGDAIITNLAGDVFYSGETDSPIFPNIFGGLITTTIGRDAFIIKFNSMGIPQWGTYYGGTGECDASGIAINSVDEIYLVGTTTSSTLPLVPTANSFLQGLKDGFIAKFNPSGNVLLHARYFGGNSSDDDIKSIAIDKNDNVYFVGLTGSNSGFPITPKTGAFNQTSTTASLSSPDGFIAELNSTDNLIWCSYFGGDNADNFASVRIGVNNNVLCSGSTLSTIPATSGGGNPTCGVPLSPSFFPDCNPGGGAYFSSYSGTGIDHDAIIVEFNQNGVLQWSTYFGGQGNEQTDLGGIFKNHIAVNPTNPNIFYLVGSTTKQIGFPTTATGSAYAQTASFSSVRGYIAKFNKQVIEWATVFGAGSNTFGVEAVCDNSNNVYFIGHTQTPLYGSVTCSPTIDETTQFPICHPIGVFKQPLYGGGSAGDAFISAFNSSNSLIWSTYYGGSAADEAHAVTYDNAFNRIYMTGITQSTSGFPLLDPNTGNYQQNISAGGTNNRDSYIARFCLDSLVGINELRLRDVNLLVYPNPTTYNFTIDFTSLNESGLAKIQIINSLGVLIKERKATVNQTSKLVFNVSDYAKGIYIVQIVTEKKNYISKLIIQ
jgi:hypothetical protein